MTRLFDMEVGRIKAGDLTASEQYDDYLRSDILTIIISAPILHLG